MLKVCYPDILKRNLRESGRLKHDFETGAFFVNKTSGHIRSSNQFSIIAPSRLSSDHLVTSFFQEYHPLFPILHRPSFLKLYEKLISCSETATEPSHILPNHALAELYLVFAIAARNSEVCIKPLTFYTI